MVAITVVVPTMVTLIILDFVTKFFFYHDQTMVSTVGMSIILDFEAKKNFAIKSTTKKNFVAICYFFCL